MNTSEAYKKIVQKLANQEPVLPGKEKFADEIIDKIRKTEQQKNPKIFYLVVRPAITVAAIFLIGLFIFQQAKDSQNFETKSISEVPEIQMNHYSMEDLFNKNKLDKEINRCLDKSKTSSIFMDRECAAKIIMMYKIELKENKIRKQKIRNWFNP